MLLGRLCINNCSNETSGPATAFVRAVLKWILRCGVRNPVNGLRVRSPTHVTAIAHGSMIGFSRHHHPRFSASSESARFCSSLCAIENLFQSVVHDLLGS